MESRHRTASEDVRVDPDVVIDLATALIRIPTVPALYPPGEAEAVGLVAATLEREGIPCVITEVRPGRPNLVVTLGDGDGPTLWINGHLDTVPAGNRLNWRHEPFGGDLVDGRLVGRGASDCKGGVAALVAALVALVRAGTKIRGRLIVSFVMGEEEGQVGMRALLDGGLRADAFVSVQWSTPRRLAIGYRGLCWIELRTSGRAAHGSRPSEGVNAVEHMVELVLPALKDVRLLPAAEGDGSSPGATVNLGSIQGGEAVNLVPDSCRATLDFRLTRGQRSGDVLAAIDERLARLRAAHPSLAVERRVLLQVEPVWTDVHSTLVQRVSAAVEAVTGVPPVPFAKTGTSDANLVHERLQIPAVAFGPGNDSGHAPDEWVAVDDLTTAADIYAAFIPRFFAHRESD